MKLDDIVRYCGRYGVQIHEEWDDHDARKRYYKMVVPVFAADQVIPAESYEHLERRPSGCMRYMMGLLEDEKFKAAAQRWLQTEQEG